MNKPAFYDVIRPALFGGKITQSQVEGIEALLEATKGLEDERHIAYILATAYHETAKTMQPIEEYGRGKGYDYGKKLKRTRKPYTFPDKLYFGRGMVQITWYENYEYVGRVIGVDLLNHPEKALEMDTSCKIAVAGMTKGLFTGVKLSTYFNDKSDRPEEARKIINGEDCAEKIAHYHSVFLDGLYAE